MSKPTLASHTTDYDRRLHVIISWGSYVRGAFLPNNRSSIIRDMHKDAMGRKLMSTFWRHLGAA